MTLGSLFDGSGGFPIAGALSGIRPVWAAEVEPYPIAVTRSRFPQMRHLGSVTGVHGDKVQPVDVITFGSPCQDMSVAGKRAGMKHEGNGDDQTTRSGLFYEAVRIIREMRQETNGRYPTFAVWENVPGAFSSNKGEDFRCVLKEFVHVCDEKLSVPRPANGRWNTAGEIVGDGYSVAWRQLDAQYWGVPQRRKRIYLVADFAGGRAGEILFEREGLRGHPAACGATGQGAAADAPGSTGRSRGVECLNLWDAHTIRQYAIDGVFPAICFKAGQGAKARSLGESETVTPTLGSEAGGNSVPAVCYPKVFHSLTAANAGNVESAQQPNCVCYPQVARTLTAEADASPCIDRGQNVVCYDARGNGDGTRCPTLTGDHENRVMDYTAVTVYRSPKIGEYAADGIASTMAARDFKSPRDLVVEHPPVYDVDCRNAVLDEEKTHTLQAKANGGQSLNCTPSVLTSGKPPRKYIIRRLTPLECCRLQGFPDGWGVPDHKDRLSDEELAFWQQVRDTSASIAGKQPKKYSAEALTKWYNSLHTDSAEYKMWGNGIALPCAAFVLGGVAEELRIWPKEE